MKVTVLVRTLSILQVIFISTAAADDDYDTPRGKCNIGNGGDVTTAVAIKESLIQDLIAKVPADKSGGQSYCNELTLNGLVMFGFGQCRTRGRPDAEAECNECLNSVGNYLIMYCNDTGAGHVWDKYSFCDFTVGFSRDAVCP